MRKKKILLIEDNVWFRELLELLLKEEGYEIVTAKNGREGIEKCDNSFDILITDRQMPGMLGEEVIHRIKQLYPEIRAILMTSDLLDDNEKCVITAAGAEAILKKESDLVDKIEEIIQHLERR